MYNIGFGRQLICGDHCTMTLLPNGLPVTMAPLNCSFGGTYSVGVCHSVQEELDSITMHCPCQMMLFKLLLCASIRAPLSLRHLLLHNQGTLCQPMLTNSVHALGVLRLPRLAVLIHDIAFSLSAISLVLYKPVVYW